MDKLACLLGLWALLWLAPASASASGISGYLTGPDNVPVTGARLTLTAPPNEATQSRLSDAQGHFVFMPLELGTYLLTVEADGYAPLPPRTVELSVDAPRRLTLRLSPIRMDVGQVTALATPLSEQALESFSVDGRVWSGLLVHPDSTGGLELPPGFHDDALLPFTAHSVTSGAAFLGAGPAENRYALDGMDITDPLTGQATLELPLEFLERLQVSTAAASVLEAQQLGASIGLHSRYGGNAFHGDLFLYLTPYQDSGTVRQEQLPDDRDEARRWDRQLLMGQLGFDLGGYLLPDRIWFFLGVAPRLTLRQTTRQLGTTEEDWDTSSWQVPVIGRLTFNLTPDQTLQLSGYAMPEDVSGIVVDPTLTTTGLNGDPSTFLGRVMERRFAASARYTWRIPYRRTRIDLQAGYLQRSHTVAPDNADRNLDAVPDGEQPLVIHTTSTSIAGTRCDADRECAPLNYRTGGAGALNEHQTDGLEARLTVSNRLRRWVGDHLFLWGGRLRYERLEHERRYTGGKLVAFGQQDESSLETALVLLTPDGVPTANALAGSLQSVGLEGFLHDSWRVSSPLMLDLGLQVLSQRVIQGDQTLMLTSTVSPRFGASLEYSQARPGRLEVTYGRSTAPLPLWLADAALLTPDQQLESVAEPAGSNGLEALHSQVLSPYMPTASSQYAIAEGLRFAQQNELVAGVTQRLSRRLELEARIIYRTLQEALEVLPYPDTLNVLGNPGNAPGQVRTATFLSECFSALNPVSGEVESFCHESPVRTFRAAQLHVEHVPTERRGLWFMGSYTISRLEGTYPGNVPQASGTEPTSAFYIYNLLNLSPETGSIGRVGPLSHDRMHRVQARALFDLLFGIRLGAGIDARSGVPINVYGADPNGQGAVLLFPRGAAGRTGWVVDQQLSASYQLRFREPRVLILEASLFNPLRLSQALRVDERYLLNVAAPSDDEAFAPDSAAQLSCVEVGGTQSETCLRNEGFGTPETYQAPLSLRFMVRYSF